MQNTHSRINIAFSVLVLFTMMTSPLLATSRTPVAPLEERVEAAEVVFVGKVIDIQVDGEWARAKLIVQEPLRGVEKEQAIDVIWRIRIGDRPIYDVEEDTLGVALLKDKHQDRYWLRGDKFENLDKLDEIKQTVNGPQSDIEWSNAY